MPKATSIFDVLGPVMIGPSSSHSAGVVKIGLVARQLLMEEPVKADITFFNSLAETYRGHGSDKAIVGGILGFKTDDTRIRTAKEIAAENGLQFSFHEVMKAPKLHPNTVKVELQSTGGRRTSVTGQSIGGGAILIVEIDGFRTRINLTFYTLDILADDVKGSISKISALIAEDGVNIANMNVTRTPDGKKANMVVEIDHQLSDGILAQIQSLEWVQIIRQLAPV